MIFTGIKRRWRRSTLNSVKRRRIESNQSHIVKQLYSIMRQGLPSRPPLKVFKPKQPEVEVLKDYSKPPNEDF